MSYSYEIEKKKLFTDEGQRLFLDIRDNINRMLAESGAVTCVKAMTAPNIGAFDSWTALACVERMLELGEIQEVTNAGTFCQKRVFVRGE